MTFAQPEAPDARKPARPLSSRSVAGRIRVKFILLHTVFSVTMAVILLLALRPAMRTVLAEEIEMEVGLGAQLVLAGMPPDGLDDHRDLLIQTGTPEALNLSPDDVELAANSPGEVVITRDGRAWPAALAFAPATDAFVLVEVMPARPTRALNRIYLLVTLSMLGIYAIVALTLELLILPKQVYEPINQLLRADAAVQRGERNAELIPEARMPGDEMGRIMRSRNASVIKLREQEDRLAAALSQVEAIAAELKRKNHLLENAKRNLADQDRLVSLGMLSAGLAHEMNTPLSVLKGTVEQMRSSATDANRSQVELMHRVVARLERLSESLLDFARVRPPSTAAVAVRGVVEEAWTLVSIDRDAKGVRFRNTLDDEAVVRGDVDRLTQVFVNILRNAVDAMKGRGEILVEARHEERDGARWLTVSVTDTGPGMSPEILARLFEPFATTRLDAQGTGLGLAVAESIVEEHGGTIIARNRTAGGARFDIMLPTSNPGNDAPARDDAPRGYAVQEIRADTGDVSNQAGGDTKH